MEFLILALVVVILLLLVVVDLTEMIFDPSFILYAWRAVQVWILGYKLKKKNLIVAMNIYTGGTERNSVNEDARKAIQTTQMYLKSLGVRFGEIYHEVAFYPRDTRIWRDKITQTCIGTADLVVIGEWKIWQAAQVLHFSYYRNKGTDTQGSSRVLSLTSIRPKWWTRKILCQQFTLVVLQGLADINPRC